MIKRTLLYLSAFFCCPILWVGAEPFGFYSLQGEEPVVLSHLEQNINSESSQAMLPAGTRIVIPQVILDEFQQHEDEYGTAFNYLFDQYSVIEDSELLKGESSYYIPLSLGDTEDVKRKTVLLDITNVQRVANDKNAFITRRNAPLIEIIISE